MTYSHYFFFYKISKPRILYPSKSSYKYDRETKAFSYKLKLIEFVTTKLPVQKVVKVVLYERKKKAQNLEQGHKE